MFLKTGDSQILKMIKEEEEKVKEYSKCPKCGLVHDPNLPCPENNNGSNEQDK